MRVMMIDVVCFSLVQFGKRMPIVVMPMVVMPMVEMVPEQHQYKHYQHYQQNQHYPHYPQHQHQ